MAQIRKARIEDAASLVELFKQLDEETNFMLFEPGERTITVNEQVDRLKAFENSTTEAMFVAKNDGTILGFAVGIGGSANRNRHSAYIVIGRTQRLLEQRYRPGADAKFGSLGQG